MAGVQARSLEEKEEMEILLLLPSLVEKGYIDATELQNIMFKNKLADKQLEIYKIMMVKEQNIAVKILNSFRKMTSGISARKNYHANHPLLTEVIADCIFGYLPTNDILSCRLVCGQWKTASKNILRKRVTINFGASGPSRFLNDFQNTLPADVPFQNFNFSDYAEGRKISEIQKFFDEWGSYVKKLTFRTKRLFGVNENKFLDSFDITPWILKATNLIELYVWNTTARIFNNKDTIFEIQLSKLNYIKDLSFYGEGCLICIEDILRSKLRIKPLKINMNSVVFLKGKQRFRQLCLNDIIDFNEATEIRLSNSFMTRLGSTQISIDMEGWFLKAQYMCLCLVNVHNWTDTKGTISFFNLDHPSYEIVERYSNSLKIQQMLYEYADVYLSTFPVTIEKLHFSLTTFFHQTHSQCRLLNLNYLRFDDCSKFNLMSNFTPSSNLVEIELGQSCVNEESVTLDVHWIPKSVKRLKINSMQVKISHRDESEDNMGEDIQDDGYFLELDTLILEDYLHCLDTYVSQMMTKIKPLVLVVTCMDKDKAINTTSIYDFVCANKQLEKIVVGSTEDLYKNTPFNTSAHSQIVKEKANYYVFENLLEKERNNGNEVNKAVIGKTLFYGEFCNYRKMNGLDRRYFINGDRNWERYDWKK